VKTARLVPLRRVAGEIAELSDEALLAACATGDAAALGALFDRFNLAVYRFAARLATTDELARDDLVQATFLEVSRIASKFGGRSSVKTWILGVTANLARHQLRSEQRRRAHQAQFLDRAQPDPTPEDSYDRKRLLARIGVALAELPYDLQIPFVLCDLEQLPGTEVARVLEIPEGTLWRRLHQARKAVRAAVTGGAR
jgi:RNA polymerase sigma-70 factor (ECF subfamily)